MDSPVVIESSSGRLGMNVQRTVAVVPVGTGFRAEEGPVVGADGLL